jgi:hypothetical protein
MYGFAVLFVSLLLFIHFIFYMIYCFWLLSQIWLDVQWPLCNIYWMLNTWWWWPTRRNVPEDAIFYFIIDFVISFRPHNTSIRQTSIPLKVFGFHYFPIILQSDALRAWQRFKTKKKNQSITIRVHALYCYW